MTRELLVAIHASAGLLGLVVGLAVISPPKTNGGRRRFWRVLYAGLLVVLVVSLLALLATDWPDLENGARLAFAGLAVLSIVMLARMQQAHRLAHRQAPGWQQRYVGHVYFTYVSLWVGFAIIPALRSPLPAVFVPIAVIAVLATGNHLVHRYERKIGLRLRGHRAGSIGERG